MIGAGQIFNGNRPVKVLYAYLLELNYAWILLCSGLGTYVWYFHLWYCDSIS